MTQQLLETIAALSHEFGTPDYVKGGGGNTSVKTGQTVWIKPSGTTLSTMSPENFVPMDRKKIEHLFQISPPADAVEREAMVKKLGEDAVCDDQSARPSVEAPLHHCFEKTFVVHTHPPLVNGMLCGDQGKEQCLRLFPDALWIDYVDPGYTLAVKVRSAIKDYIIEHDEQPDKHYDRFHFLAVITVKR